MSGFIDGGRIEHGLWVAPEVFGHAPSTGRYVAPRGAAASADAGAGAAPSQEPSMALLEQARKGEEAAGKEIVSLLHPMVARLVSRQIRRNADVEDVVQEVFIKVFVKMHQYRGIQPFSHWVSRLAVTTCYDWLRRQKVRPAIMASDLTEAERKALEHLQSQSEDSGGNDDPDLVSGLLDRLIAALKPQEQIVIRLLDLEERSVAEISGLTGWGQSKVKVTAFRARKKLNTLLKQLESP
jgi:RNA polymerase sigma factor (sigma-70 family)